MKNLSSFKARRSLGQNFLHNLDVVQDIIHTGVIKKDEAVLEIGPGTGVLTRALLSVRAKVTAIEKDVRLITELEQKFAKEIADNKLTLIQGDVLDFDILSLFSPSTGSGRLTYKLIANIPYYITGEILRKFLTAEHQPSRMVLLVQKEVAERITDTRESILSLSVKAYGTPSIVRYVSRNDFVPVPDVDSAVILIENISREFFQGIGSPSGDPISKLGCEQRFFDLIKKGFAHKRKKLSSNLALGGFTSKLMGNRRAEELSLNDWFELYETYEQDKGAQD